ncbi:DUF2911 domain-containing protein [Fulvivirga ulvae]|uniref:DUF2911 domain-containing protein n=1 Tax=Fulvivirga ulvae TaxID=2904245 RepID=UPI001F17E5E7|nr:DUF2911 domain-containing protein [Fulvivirga ulvae]UII32565.1 DUF2911 domain-containing protein [Fulvivirga ulvae]
MKKYNLTFLLAVIALIASPQLFAQKKMKSPPAQAKGQISGANVVIDYHQPSANGRTILGDLVPYDEVWRTGANNATTFEVDKDVKIEGQTLPKGKYALFTIPGKDEWTIIFNKNHNQWGSSNYDEAEDALRVNVKPTKTSKFVETFTINPEQDGVVLSWENTKVKFKVAD